ncbi:MAG: hypothetical protein ACR5K7_00260 [Symbiopectobacterium sp.]
MMKVLPTVGSGHLPHRAHIRYYGQHQCTPCCKRPATIIKDLYLKVNRIRHRMNAISNSPSAWHPTLLLGVLTLLTP